jgi:hypothetical protein
MKPFRIWSHWKERISPRLMPCRQGTETDPFKVFQKFLEKPLDFIFRQGTGAFFVLFDEHGIALVERV